MEETQGPYEVTSKENGCIIFIVAMSNEEIVVTSKHSMPEVKTDATAHAGVGYNWVLKHLESVGKTEKDLASWLFDKNVTLVAEVNSSKLVYGGETELSVSFVTMNLNNIYCLIQTKIEDFIFTGSITIQ